MPILAPDEKNILVETARHNAIFGNLYLTNKRLIFEHESGIFSRRVYETLDLPLEGIASASVEGLVSRRLIVCSKKGFISSFPVRLDFSVGDPVRWQNSVLSAVKSRLESLESDKKKERIQLVLDFAALRDYMAKGGLVLQTTKCPECGAPIRLPENGSQTKCEHCGNMVLAQDIFEKIKSLI